MATFPRVFEGEAAARFGPAFALVALLAVGCSREPDGYDPALRYADRADPIAVSLPVNPPTAMAEAGKIDEAISRLALAGGKVLDPRTVPAAERAALTKSLEDLFGTPANPLIPDSVKLPGIDLSPTALAHGSRAYKRLCLQCHGIPGDGRGPGGPWLNPLPRDFRHGYYKASTSATARPRVDDLRRVIRGGVPNTAMQSFDSLNGADVDAVVGYVIHLSLRGEVELSSLKHLLGDDGEPVDTAADLGRIAKQWDAAQAPAAVAGVPAENPDAESLRRGEKLFATAGCAACHVDYGRADQFRYDIWGLPNRVADLTAGKYRWGGSPEDLARRVRHGIPAANMPANPGLSEADVRDLAGFVRALPAPGKLPDDVRGRVYAK